MRAAHADCECPIRRNRWRWPECVGHRAASSRATAGGYGRSMITAAGIRAAIARLVDSGNPPTMENVANELHVKTIELEPLVHQMFRDGQLDPSVDTIHEPESPTGSRVAADAMRSEAGGGRRLAEPAGRTLVSPHPGSGSGAVSHLLRERLRVDRGRPRHGPTQLPRWHRSCRRSLGDRPGAVGHRRSAALHLRRHHRHDHRAHRGPWRRDHRAPLSGGEPPASATFRDPAGNVLGLWQEVTPPEAT